MTSAGWRFWQAAPSPEHLLALALRSELDAVDGEPVPLEPGAELRTARSSP